MSIKYMDRVWDNRELKGGSLLLMLALADHANDAGECWPSQRHLAEKARLTERQVRRVVNSLIDAGYLAIAEQGIGRGKRTLYRLYPSAVKADILSGGKADIRDTENRTFCPQKSGHSRQQKADIGDTKADIGDAFSSHARSEPSIEPTTEEPSVESSSSTDEDEKTAQEVIYAAWLEHYGSAMPENIKLPIEELIAECGLAAVVYAISAGAAARARMFSYIVKCARNYVPDAPTVEASYRVDLGVNQMPPARPPIDPFRPPGPQPHDDSTDALQVAWFRAKAEVLTAQPLDSPMRAWLEGSYIAEAGKVDNGAGLDVPLYRVVVQRADGVQWLNNRAAGALRRALGAALGSRIMVEVVCQEVIHAE